jgi:CRP-like cAMP-binding protein
MAKRMAMAQLSVPFKQIERYLGELVKAEERLDFKEGQVIFYAGHQPYGVYILRKGRVRFAEDRAGKEKLLCIIEAGQMFGEKECISDSPYRYSAKAETDSQVSFFSRSVFDMNKL